MKNGLIQNDFVVYDSSHGWMQEMQSPYFILAGVAETGRARNCKEL